MKQEQEMSMPPAGITSGMDEETVIEAEILQELDFINLDNDDLNNNVGADDLLENVEENEDEEEPMLDKVQDYLGRLQQQTDRFEQELSECDQLINHHHLDSTRAELTEDFVELIEAASRTGEDPQLLKRKILDEIDKEEEEEELTELPPVGDTVLLSKETELLSVCEDDTEVLVGRDDEGCEVEGDQPAEELTLRPEDGMVVLVDDLQAREQFFRAQLHEMELKYKQRAEKWKQEAEERRRETEQRENAENERRRQIALQYKQEEEDLLRKQKLAQEKLDAEIEEKRRKIQDDVKQFEEQITQLTANTVREQEELELSIQEQEEKQRVRQTTAAMRLQAGYRGYRVRKSSDPILKEKRMERAKQREARRIEEVENEIKQRKEEAKRKEDEKHQQEEDRKRQEEERRQEEIRKMEEEKRKQEEEQGRLAEEKRRKEEEERRKKEEKERKEEEKRKEEERKQREEEERLKEEERKRREQEEKDKEETRIREEKEREEARIREEQKKEEEKSKREAEERLRKEAEEKLRLEEENRNKEEKRLKEEERMKNDCKETADKMEGKTEGRGVGGEITPGVNTGKQVLVQDEDAMSVMTEDLSDLTESKSNRNTETLGNTLPSHIEAKRLAWIKECLPWSKVSNEPWKLKGGISKKPPRRPSSAKKLPPLSEDLIISAARVATLRQVTTVQLQDLPGCNLSTLGQCWGLRSLAMTNCQLVSVDSLQQCRQLQYLSLQENKIEYLDLKDLGNLQYADLSHNHIAVIHGLDGCTNLRWLDLSHNRITRLGGLDPLRRLHTLLLSRNQLIACRGVCDVPTLQHLDLSHNHLQEVDSLVKLCLLQRLDMSANNLLQFPDLKNQVLLEECNLTDNSISSMSSLPSLWLPRLHSLHMAQNSLTELESLDNLILLKNLSVAHNQLADLDNIVSSVGHLRYLEEFGVEENPATDDAADYRDRFTRLLPRLKSLDGDAVAPTSSSSVVHPASDFEALCLTQSQSHSNIRNTFLHDLQSTKSKSPLDHLALCDVYFRYCDKSFKMAVEHRYSHEYGEVSINMPTVPSTPKSGRPRSARTKTVQRERESYLSPKEMFEKALKSPDSHGNDVKQSPYTEPDNPKDLFERALKANTAETVVKTENPRDLFEKALSSQTQVVENAEERPSFGSHQEQTGNVSMTRNAEEVSMAWSGPAQPTGEPQVRASLQNLPPDEAAILEELHSAATKIQALWRGYILRLKLSAALEYARMEEEEGLSDLDDFNMDDIAFDEDNLDRGWRPTDSPQIPHSHPVLGKPPIGRKPDVLKLDLLTPVHPPNRPRHAWRNVDSPLSDLAPHPPRPPSSMMTATDTHRTGHSKREEKLAEEWGFHNSRTAELMLQRAKKMKLNSDRKKKLSRLDPKQRLALFRKLEESTKLTPVRPPNRRTLPRKEYFQAREEEMQQQEFMKRLEATTRSTRTYEWLHTQVANFDTQEENIEQNTNFGSEGNISLMAAAEMAGSYRFPLVTHTTGQPGSVDSYGGEDRAAKPRRFSSGENLSQGGSTFLPPIKTSSAGSGSSSGRRKEKMSWRTKPVDVDIGWGGGRKRQAHK